MPSRCGAKDDRYSVPLFKIDFTRALWMLGFLYDALREDP